MTQSYMHIFIIALNATIFVVTDIKIFNINNKIHVRGEADAMEVMITSRSVTFVNHELWANACLPPLCNVGQLGLS